MVRGASRWCAYSLDAAPQMITIPYASPLLARQSRLDAGWDQIPGGRYTHGKSIARIDGCDVVIMRAHEEMLAELSEVVENSAALREEVRDDAKKRQGRQL